MNFLRAHDKAGGTGIEVENFNRKEVTNMPGFDGTGPMGAGSMTGRGLGNCNPAGSRMRPGTGRGMGLGFRRGFGSGMGRGFGRGMNFNPNYNMPAYQMNSSDELNMLKAEAEALKQDMESINMRIKELKNDS